MKEKINAFADMIAAIVILSLVVFVGMGLTSTWGAVLSSVGATWFGLYALIVSMSATKLYGKKVYEVVRGAGSNFSVKGGNNGP